MNHKFYDCHAIDKNPVCFGDQVSRSIGDVYLKKPEINRDPMFREFASPIPLKRPVMTAEPSIIKRELKEEDMFIIFASDGLWEQLSDEAAVKIVFNNPRAVSFSFQTMPNVVIINNIRKHETAISLSTLILINENYAMDIVIFLNL